MKLLYYQKKMPRRVALFDLGVESRKETAGVLRGYFAEHWSEPVAITEFDSFVKLAYACKENPFDMAFVVVNNMKGVEAARRVYSFSEQTALILISDTDEYAMEGYQMLALHYILKPLEPIHIEQALDKHTIRELQRLGMSLKDIEDAPWVLKGEREAKENDADSMGNCR